MSTAIVVDVGALTHGGGADSARMLIDRFDPGLLFAFDPHPHFAEGVQLHDKTLVVSRRLAAWTFDGPVYFSSAASRSSVAWGNGDLVQAFDFPSWLKTLPAGVVVKIDAEGAEYPLLRSIHIQGIDSRLSELLIEWHDKPLDLPFRCKLSEWDA